MKKIFLPFLLALSLFACTSSRTVVSPQNPFPITILQINDVYEIAPLQNGTVGGMARVASLKQELRALNPNTYLVLAGDFLSPSVIGTVKMEGERIQGAQMVDVMNQVGVDWVVFGNHEFDIKEEALQKRLDESQFHWIGGNVSHVVDEQKEAFRQGDQPLREYAIWEFGEKRRKVKIGVLGVCLDANPQPFVAYEDVFATAGRVYETIKDSVDFCIALTHLALEQDQELARRIPELRLIMGGHEHERHYEKVGSVPITKADANARSAWVHQLIWNGEALELNSRLRELDSSVVQNPAIKQVVEDWEEKAYVAFKEQGFDLEAVVAVVKEPLDGMENHIRTRQTNLGLAMTKGMYEAAGDVDCAIVNGGSVRIDDILSGRITEFDLIRALPFGGGVLKVDLRGELLVQILEAGESNRGTGGYLQRYRVEKGDGKWFIDMQPIQPDRVYRIAITDFLLKGLEANMEFLTPENPKVQAIIYPGSESSLRDIRLVLAEYLKKQ